MGVDGGGDGGGGLSSFCLWNNEYNGTGVMTMKPSLPRVQMNRLQCVTNQGKLCNRIEVELARHFHFSQ